LWTIGKKLVKIKNKKKTEEQQQRRRRKRNCGKKEREIE